MSILGDRRSPTSPYAFPDVPGLVLEPMTETHLDAAAVLLGEVFAHWKCSGDHDDWGYAAGAAPPCEGPASHARAQLAQVLGDGGTWCTALTFAGRVLQFEILAVADRVAEVALLLRTTRERPSWFWREVERPVVAGLAAAGVGELQEWIAPEGPGRGTHRRRAFLEQEFRAACSGAWRAGGARCWSMTTESSRFTGWPPRRLVGFDETAGRLRVWEAAEADLPALRGLIDQTVPITRKPLALRMLEEWWHLDRATILLGARDGQLRYARAIRPRKGTVAGFAILSGVFDEPEQVQMGQAVLTWCKRAGYTSVTAFIPSAHLPIAGIPGLMAATPMRVVAEHRQYREPFTELEVPVP